MLAIKKEYVVSDNNKKKAVLVDIDTFNKMEELLENYGLAKYMNEVKEEKNMSLRQARKNYAAISKG
jgi:PHD/YefM family antitoxin component YafN of YafNO toxin-antitoxin module